MFAHSKPKSHPGHSNRRWLIQEAKKTSASSSDGISSGAEVILQLL